MVNSTHRGWAAAGPHELGQAAGGRIHTEKFVSSKGPTDLQDGALRVRLLLPVPASPTPIEYRNIK